MKKALTVLFACIFATTAYSQSNFGKIQGKVIDAKTKAPVGYATIILERDGIQKGGTYTDESGKYVINALEPGDYTVTVKFLDYSDKKITDVEVNSNATAYVNIEMSQAEDGATELGPIVVRRGKPLIEKDKNTTTLSSKDITKLPTRSLNAIASTAAGVNQANNGGINFLGSRSDGTAYFVDGVRVVGSGTVPQAAQGQIDIIQSGVPAQYGDFTGGAISVTTKGPSRAVRSSFEAISSSPFDPYHFNQIEFSTLGPLWVKNKGGGDKEYVALGYLIAGNFNYTADPRPVFGGTYSVKQDVLDNIEANPLVPDPNDANRFVYRSNFIDRDDLELNKARKNAARMIGNLQTKLEFQPNKNTTITAFGSFNNANSNNWGFAQSLLNFDDFSVSTSQTLTTYLKFTQRLGNSEVNKEEEKPLFSDAFYNVRLDYQSRWTETENPDHGDNLFQYGHVGRFTEFRRPVYVYQDDASSFVDQNGDTVIRQGYWSLEDFGAERIEFEASDYNPLRGKYTQQVFDFFSDRDIDVTSDDLVRGFRGLYNGFNPDFAYSLWTNPGFATSSYSRGQNERIAAYAQGEAILNLENPHDLQFGMYFEQTFFSSWNANATGLWTLMPLLANRHIAELDRVTENGITYGGIHSYDENGFFTDTINYNIRVDADQQSTFDRNLRDKLIADGATDVYGNPYTETSFIDINSLDPSVLSLDMFSADNLWNNGNPLVSYFGYDYLGNRKRGNFSFNDFANDEENRTLGSFSPVYNAIWFQDKFQFKDLILRLGVRVERYDANQSALRDQYSLYPTYSAGEITADFDPSDGRGVNLLNGYTIPSNIGDDYVVYVNSVDNPSQIIGYRDGATWYDAEGIELSSPDVLTQETSNNRIIPFLVSTEEELVPESFQDYDPVINVLPRIWFSFPINSEAQLFANYDKLAQRPADGNIFVPFSTLYFLEANQGAVVGNGLLRPRITTAYEFGFKQTLSQNSALSLIASYRETRDDYALVRINQAYPIQYNSFANLDFSNTKSFRAEYELRGERRTSLRLNYTLQYADGTASNSQSAAALIQANQPNLRSLYPMDFDTRHVINAIFDYRFKGGNEYTGPIWFDRKVFQNSGANFIVTSRSGQPYSAYSNPAATALFGAAQRQQLDGNPNGSRLPWQFRVDANLMKDFNIKKKNPKDQYRSPYTQIRVFLWIQNMLNNRNVQNVYGFSDLPDDDGWLSSREGQQDAANQLSTQSYIDLYNIKVNNPFFYATPRQIRLGVKLFF